MARQRPPEDDDQKTAIYDSQQGKRMKSPTRRGHGSGEIEIGTPTEIDPPRKERSEPIRVISMKTPAELAAEKKQAKKRDVKIRALSEVIRPDQTPPRAMGNLAPPVDLRERNVRKLRDWLIWGSVLVIISCTVMLGVWFLAR